MILVTGANGLLGSHLCARYPKDTIGFTHSELDVTDEDSVLTTLSRVRPDVVVNCAGITRPEKVDAYQVYLVNTFAPKNLAYWCDELKIRFIQISTNCVFSGRVGGNYHEYEEPDAKDLYGRTKAQGEVYNWEYTNSLNIRTSFVGWPDPSGRGLLAWLHKQRKEKAVPGYRNVWWNGLTVTDLADQIIELAYSPMTGIAHLIGETITKYELLSIAEQVYGWGHEIFEMPYPAENKTLKQIRLLPYKSSVQTFKDSCYLMKESGMREYDNAH